MMNAHIKNEYTRYEYDPKDGLDTFRHLANRVFIRLNVAAMRGELPNMLPMPLVFEDLCKQWPGNSSCREYDGDGHYVWVQHCIYPYCDEYLGVNYPSEFCKTHDNNRTSDASL